MLMRIREQRCQTTVKNQTVLRLGPHRNPMKVLGIAEIEALPSESELMFL